MFYWWKWLLIPPKSAGAGNCCCDFYCGLCLHCTAFFFFSYRTVCCIIIIKTILCAAFLWGSWRCPRGALRTREDAARVRQVQLQWLFFFFKEAGRLLVDSCARIQVVQLKTAKQRLIQQLGGRNFCKLQTEKKRRLNKCFAATPLTRRGDDCKRNVLLL